MCHLSVGICWLSFLIQIGVFLVLGVMSTLLIAGSWWNSWLPTGQRRRGVFLMAQWLQVQVPAQPSLIPPPFAPSWGVISHSFLLSRFVSLPYLLNPQIFLKVQDFPQRIVDSDGGKVVISLSHWFSFVHMEYF